MGKRSMRGERGSCDDREMNAYINTRRFFVFLCFWFCSLHW